jgi:hypothetical protein
VSTHLYPYLDSLLQNAGPDPAWECLESLSPSSARDEAANRLRSEMGRSPESRWKIWLEKAQKKFTESSGDGRGLATATGADPMRSQQLGETFASLGDDLSAALAYLAMADIDESRSRYASFRAEEVYRKSEQEGEAKEWLAELTQAALLRLSTPGLGALESMLWTARHPELAWKVLEERDRKKSLSSEEALIVAQKAIAQGWGSPVYSLLQRKRWEAFSSPLKKQAFQILWKDAVERKALQTLIRLSQMGSEFLKDPERILEITEVWLRQGETDSAGKWLKSISNPRSPLRHRHMLLQARWEGYSGQWKKASQRLADWKRDPTREFGTGEILYWQGWAAWHQGFSQKADSLWFSSSSYTEEVSATWALSKRLQLKKDSAACTSLFNGIEEAPNSTPRRLSALEKVPRGSSLKPDALWARVQLRGHRGESDSAQAALEELAKSHSSAPLGKRARLVLAYSKEMQGETGKRSALVEYERLLLESPQGMASEFARNRLRALDTTLP